MFLFCCAVRYLRACIVCVDRRRRWPAVRARLRKLRWLWCGRGCGCGALPASSRASWCAAAATERSPTCRRGRGAAGRGGNIWSSAAAAAADEHSADDWVVRRPVKSLIYIYLAVSDAALIVTVAATMTSTGQWCVWQHDNNVPARKGGRAKKIVHGGSLLWLGLATAMQLQYSTAFISIL
jgi:hypothetical protein